MSTISLHEKSHSALGRREAALSSNAVFADGSTYTINGLVPGDFYVEAIGQLVSTYLRKYYKDQTTLASSIPVTVLVDLTTTDIDFTLA